MRVIYYTFSTFFFLLSSKRSFSLIMRVIFFFCLPACGEKLRPQVGCSQRYRARQCNDCPRCFVIAKQKVSKREGGGGGKKGSSHPRGRNGSNFIANRTCGSTNLLLLSGRIMQFRGYNVPFMRSGIRLIYLRTTFDFHLSSFRQLYTFRQRERERESK